MSVPAASLRKTAAVLPAAAGAPKLGGVGEKFPRSNALVSGLGVQKPEGCPSVFKSRSGLLEVTGGLKQTIERAAVAAATPAGKLPWGPEHSAAPVRGPSFRAEFRKPTSKKVPRPLQKRTCNSLKIHG